VSFFFNDNDKENATTITMALVIERDKGEVPHQ